MEMRRTKILGFSLLLGGLALCGVGLWLLLSPPQYRAEVRITTNPDINLGKEYQTSHLEIDRFDSYSIALAVEEIQSDTVLTNVVATLNLNDEWGKKYSWRGKLETKQTVELLRKRMNVQRVGKTEYIEIGVIGGNPNEALKIANVIVEAFRDYRIRSLILDGIKNLEGKFKQGEQEIKAQRERVEQLKGKIPEPVPELPSPTTTYPLPDRVSRKPLDTNVVAYFEAERKLEKIEEFQKLIAVKIQFEKDHLPTSRSSLLRIESPATLPQITCGPDRILGALLLGVGLFPTIGGFLLLNSARRQFP